MTMMKKRTIILIPYPAQGHVTPMLKFASLLSNLGFRPVVITPEFIHRRISPQINPENGILCLSIPDGLDAETPRDFFSIERAMEENMPPVLEALLRKLIDELEEEEGGIACLVADLLASWAVDIAQRCGVAAAGFWPAMHATYRLIAAIPHLIQTGVISENGKEGNFY
ncbi:UNVERIFIED_CONTAM: UDP-glycosyltransferase 82A1 [Sesamum radiatum]|uniref:UDP-glycosyltransferase 82A1 n=1 Tax=Sesamum radiatum TaxID=300843 RepID=A0AAW2KLJ0_SESRA